MIPLDRPAEAPEPLASKAPTWLENFLERRAKEPGRRPPSSQYAHPNVKDVLRAMSHGKCFYCETKLEQQEETVDHYVELSRAPDLAFDWHNLYLSCSPCQQPLLESSVPRAACIDPCRCAGDEPSRHLRFDNEVPRPRGGSEKGRQTIRKYKLDGPALCYRRSRALTEFLLREQRLRAQAMRDGRTALTDEELDQLRDFAQPEQPFSLMFQQHLQNVGLINAS